MILVDCFNTANVAASVVQFLPRDVCSHALLNYTFLTGLLGHSGTSKAFATKYLEILYRHIETIFWVQGCPVRYIEFGTRMTRNSNCYWVGWTGRFPTFSRQENPGIRTVSLMKYFR